MSITAQSMDVNEVSAYHVTRVNQPAGQLLDLSDWQAIPALDIAQVHAKSSAHQPATQCRMAWQPEGIHLRFDVDDQYVCCRQAKHQGPICTDSCVEAFLQPDPEKGYFNFEINPAGMMHASYIYDNSRTSKGFKGVSYLSPTQLEQIKLTPVFDQPFEDEIPEPMSWSMTVWIPVSVFEDFLGPISVNDQTRWRGNFYKCADASSHPHWLSWQSVGEQLSFHKPSTFGSLIFR